jgi:hypothetical protein
MTPGQLRVLQRVGAEPEPIWKIFTGGGARDGGGEKAGAKGLRGEVMVLGGDEEEGSGAPDRGLVAPPAEGGSRSGNESGSWSWMPSRNLQP